MKTSIYLVLLAVFVLSCEQAKTIKGQNHVALSIEQFGNSIEPIDGTYYLDKEAFNLVFKFKNPNYILVNASHNNKLMFKALNDENLVAQPQFTIGNIIAETYFNKDKEIMTSNEASSAWMQESRDKHMFNSLTLENETYTAIRTINNSFDLDKNYNTQIKFIQKPLYLVFVVIDKNTDLEENVELQRITIKIDWLENPQNALEAPADTDSLLSSFNLLTDSFTLKQLPVSDDTNFNNTELAELLSQEEANLLQLGKIYPNFFTEGYSFKVKPSYRLNINQNIKTLVVNVAKGEHELETLLINYNIDGNLIDHKIIAYDDIAEGMHKVSSTIKNNLITTTHYWIDEEHDTVQHFTITEDGQINRIEILDIVLQELDIKKEAIYTDFLISEELTLEKQLLLIPKISKQTHDELILDAYILLANPLTGAIEAKFTHEAYWYGDAIKVSNIEADYQPYKLSKDAETIGVKVYYNGSSLVNPYVSNTLTLFVKQDDSLKPVLKEYEVYNKTGENDGQGTGFYTEKTKTITTEVDSLKTFYNLKVNSTIEEVKYANGEKHDVKNYEEVELCTYQNGTYTKDNSH